MIKYFGTRAEAEEKCFNVVNTLLMTYENIKGEKMTEIADEYKCGNSFSTKIAKLSAEKICNSDCFIVEEEDTIENLWIDTAIEETNKMIEKLSPLLFGYKFKVKVDNDFDVVMGDGRTIDGEDFDFYADCYGEEIIKGFIAEDILRIATGRTFPKYSFSVEKDTEEYRRTTIIEDAVDEIACCIGGRLSYETISKVLEYKRADKETVQFCEEIIKDLESKNYSA